MAFAKLTADNPYANYAELDGNGGEKYFGTTVTSAGEFFAGENMVMSGGLLKVAGIGGSYDANATCYAGVIAHYHKWAASESGVLIKIYTRGLFVMTLASAASTDAGKLVYAGAGSSDNSMTVTLSTAENAPVVGRVEKLFGTNLVLVDITGFAFSTATGLEPAP